MKTIYKYEIPVTDVFELTLPLWSEILSVQVQGGTPYVWVKLDTEKDNETRVFRIFGTGQSIDDPRDMKFIGTFQLYNGDLVFHLFEILG